MKNGTSIEDRPRVLMIVESSAGGTGRHVLDLCEGMLSRGWDVHLVHSTIRIDGLFRERLAALPKLPRLALPITTAVGPRDFSTVLAIRRYMRAHGPFDIVHGHSSKGGALARLAAVGTGAAAFYTLHGLIMMDPGLGFLKKSFYTTIELALSLVTDGIIAVSPEEQRAAVKLGLGESRVHLVPNGISDLKLAPRTEARKTMGMVGDEPVIGFVGRLVEQKAPHILLEAFAKVVAACPAAKLAVVGDGPLAPGLRELAGRLGIAGSVIWLGERDSREVFAGFDLFALSSRKEGLPYVVLEAMFAGLPVVATAASGVEILVDPEKTGYVVPTDDANAFADALLSLVSDRTRLQSFADAALQRSRRFTAQEMVERTMALYHPEAAYELSADTAAAGTQP